jgi:hypothetical protein
MTKIVVENVSKLPYRRREEKHPHAEAHLGVISAHPRKTRKLKG